MGAQTLGSGVIMERLYLVGFLFFFFCFQARAGVTTGASASAFFGGSVVEAMRPALSGRSSSVRTLLLLHSSVCSAEDAFDVAQ